MITEYDLNLISVDSINDLPTNGSKLIIVAKIGNSYHVLIFDSSGEKVVDRKVDFANTLVRELNEASENQLIDNSMRIKIINEIKLDLDHISREEFETLDSETIFELVKLSREERRKARTRINPISSAENRRLAALEIECLNIIDTIVLEEFNVILTDIAEPAQRITQASAKMKELIDGYNDVSKIFNGLSDFLNIFTNILSAATSFSTSPVATIGTLIGKIMEL